MSERERLDELGAKLPWDRPDDARREAVRASLLSAAAEIRARRPFGRWLVVGGAFACGAAAAVLAIALWPRGDVARPEIARVDVTQLARVEAASSAQLEHTVTRTPTGSDEVVRVHAGRVRLAVDELHAGDHVRVATADAVVEGRGSFEVAVANDALGEVTVRTGTASVQIAGHQAVFLAAGQSWHASVVTADLQPVAPSAPSPDLAPPATPSTPAPPTTTSSVRTSPMTTAPPATSPSTTASTTRTSRTPATSPATTTASTTTSSTAIDKPDEPASRALAADISIGTTPPASGAARTQSQTEQHLQAGWALLRAGKAAEAAAELGKAAEGEGDLAADARYFQAVALIRAGRSTDAERALVGFLDHAPRSIRRGRASVMLARLIAARGDYKSARGWFEAALVDHDPSVVAAARDGLAGLPLAH